MNINKFILRLQITTFSPFFSLLLAFVLTTLYKILFDTVALCDNGCYPLLLQQLQDNLLAEKEKCSILINNLTVTDGIIQEIRNNPDMDLRQFVYNTRRYTTLQEQIFESWNKMTSIESEIRKIDPCFISDSDNQPARALITQALNRR